MKKIFSLTLSLISFSAIAQITSISNPHFPMDNRMEPNLISKRDSFVGQFSKVEMRGYMIEDPKTMQRSKEIYQVYQVQYASTGKICAIREQEYPEKGMYFDTLIFNSKGQVAFELNRGGEDLNEKKQFNYSAEGNNNEIVYSGLTNSVIRNLNNNQKGNLFSFAGIVSTNFTYNKEGRMENVVIVYKDHAKDSAFISYDPNGNVVKETFYKVNADSVSNGEYFKKPIILKYETAYAYSTDGKLKTITVIIPGNVASFIQRFSFSTDGLLISRVDVESKIVSGGSTQSDSTLYSYEYDAHGYLAKKQIGKFGAANPYMETFKTTYDSNGNPIECVADVAEGLMIYKWTYFPLK